MKTQKYGFICEMIFFAFDYLVYYLQLFFGY